MITYSQSGLTIAETLQVNSIVWIHSLPEAELGPTRGILEDLDILAINDGLAVTVYPVSNQAELKSAFLEVTENARRGLRPILHVDAHGTAAEGLLLAPSGERMGWPELIGYLRDLNVATENNLVCIFALCFGLNLYQEVRLSRPAPAYLFCAPSAEIRVGVLLDQTLEFYREVNRSRNVTAAFGSTLEGPMRSFHCQGLFLQALLAYIRAYCSGKQRQERKERMVTSALQHLGIDNPDSAELRELRQTSSDLLRPGPHLIARFAPTFLVDRGAAFTYEVIERALSGPLSRPNP